MSRILAIGDTHFKTDNYEDSVILTNTIKDILKDNPDISTVIGMVPFWFLIVSPFSMIKIRHSSSLVICLLCCYIFIHPCILTRLPIIYSILDVIS